VAFAEVERFLDTPVKHYSSGMYVRLAFAVAAHLEPEILIIDEVLAVGDIEFQAKCFGKMGSVARSGRTVLFVSHNLQAVQNLCTKAVLLARGRVEAVGPTADVLAAYIRSVGQGANGRPLAAHRTPGMTPVIREVCLRDGSGQTADRFPVGGAVTVEIRYDSPVPLTNPIFGVLVAAANGDRLFHLQTLSQHAPISAVPQRGVICCHVPVLPLQPGTYALSFTCSQLHVPGQLDFLDSATVLHVEEADFFGTGRLPPEQNGRFLVKADWSFAP
jgi:lipopolysaccharide transport system ATP-binding protein